MRFKLVQTLQEAMQLRVLRNSCREFLTNEKRHLGLAPQCRWYFRSYRRAMKEGSYRAYLLINDAGVAVGYGALALDQEDLLVTECVAPRLRQQGYGRLILQHLVE